MKSFVVIFLVGFLVGCSPATDPHPQTLKLNREANELFKTQNPQAATEKYIEALRFNPFQPELHLNLGLAFEFLQQADKALQSYKKADELAVQSQNPAVAFAARFNAGQLLGKAKKIDQALEYYQQALDLVPTSKEVKTNIELLTQDSQGQGQGESQDQQNQQDQEGDDKQQQQQGDQQQDSKDQDKDQKESPQKVQNSPKYQPRPYQGKELTEADVKKILGEIKQQEQRIRAEFNRKEAKEPPRDKDW